MTREIAIKITSRVRADRSGTREAGPDPAGCSERGASSGRQGGYQIRKYPDLAINRHADTGITAKSFFTAKIFPL
jgi:hypothetical protein